MFDFVQAKKTKKRKKRKFFSLKKLSPRNLVVISFFFFGFLSLSTIGLFAWYAKDLPRPDKIKRIEGISTVIFDREGKPLYDIYADENRVIIPLEEIPDHLKNATIAIEDKNFYSHQGFSARGMARAVFNIVLYRRLQGGSTLTQQLVKNVLLSSERTLPRKIKEFILAVQIERKYSKDEIFQMYLNEAPYGGTAWGVEAAAQTYFDKKAKELNLLESAVLAGFPQRPTAYSPFGADSKAYIWRTEQVLRRMREDGYISEAQEKQVKKELEKVEFASKEEKMKAPHFVMHVKQKLVEQFGEKMVEQGGLKVTTTLDLELQQMAQEVVAEEVEKIKGFKVGNGAAVILDSQNGEILAMIGSKDYEAEDEEFEGKFNIVTQALRQPGSAIKPITYAAAFKKGYTPASLIMDTPTSFPGGLEAEDYKPRNYDGQFRGPVQVRFALGNSINVAAVKMIAMVGVKEMLKIAYDLGLTTLEPTQANVNRFGLSITLGGGEVKLLDLTSAFSVFANGGSYYQPISILRVEDSQGKVLFKQKKSQGKKVLSPDISFLISHVLSDNNARKEIFGPTSWLHIPGKTVAVKTGTTDDKRDNWTIGFTRSVTVGTWVGNNDNSPMDEKLASGVTGAAPIWNRIIKEVLRKKEDGIVKMPKNVIALEIDALGGGLPKEGQPTRSEYFIKGTEPIKASSIYQALKISKETGLLANEIEIASGDYEEKDFIVLEEDDPISTDGRNRWQDGIDGWLKNIADEKYHPPKETSSGKKEELIVKIKTPDDKSQVDNHDVKIEAEAVSLAEIVKMELFVDDELKKEIHGDFLSEVVNLDDGTHKIKVKTYDSKGDTGEREVNIGVFVPWDYEEPEPTSIPSPTSTLSPTLSPTPG